MKFITRDTDYALRALMFMAKNGREVFTVDEIARDQRLPRVFLRRILQALAKGKMLASYKGKEGGFSFSVQPGRIRVTDIIRIFQGDIDLTHCFVGKRICHNRKTCAFRKKLNSINQMVNRELGKITIEGLL
ncbi:MAG: Rrf2 family transcriptional regulator [Candidatus Omnitrophota bacterium]